MSNFTKNDKRFELAVDGGIAYADYHIDGKTLFVDYVFSPEELRGTGAAGNLMQHLKDYAATEKLNITPICGYAKVWLKRNA